MKNFKKISFLFVLVYFLCVFSQAFATGSVPFESWLQELRRDAQKQGISQSTINSALTDIEPIQRVIDLDRKQPEGTMTFAQYRKRIVNPMRIQKGREMMRRHAKELAEVKEKYGVAPQYVVALWGIETNYGSNTGGFKVVPALATLAWEGRRAKFFRKELMNALKIIDSGHITAAKMMGSWAGAMGQNQFMPSSFLNFAVDGNGDNRRDIWGTKKDIFASTSNYLRKNNWRDGERWGREVHLSRPIAKDLVGTKVRKPLSFWAQKGVLKADRTPLPKEADMKASLVAPDGLGGPTYLVYNNYRSIMAWNRSTYFATSVGLLADSIAQ